MLIFVISLAVGIWLVVALSYLRAKRKGNVLPTMIPVTVVKRTVCGITAVVLKRDLVAAEAEYERKIASGEVKPSGTHTILSVPGRTLTFAPVSHWIWRNPSISPFITWRSEELETMLTGCVVEHREFFMPFSSDGLASWEWQINNFPPIPIEEARRLLESGK